MEVENPPAAWRYDYTGPARLRARRVQLEPWPGFASLYPDGTVTELYAAPPTVAQAQAALLARVQRALRLYPEWCAGWGLLRNQNAASTAASECADMLPYLPDTLPDDDEQAGCVIHKAVLASRSQEPES